jgi:dihydroorotate dehydrogenase
VYDEKQYQDMLFSFMSDTFRSLRREVPFPNKKYIDATIGNVGIELKFQPNESDIDRAYSQVESYLDHLDHVIIVISSPRTPDAMRYLEDKLERRGWLNSRVFIVEQTV